MEKYLRQLLADIGFAIEQAPPPPEQTWLPASDEEDEDWAASPQIKLCQLFDIAPEAFPPEKMLGDQQVRELLDAIILLWSAWNLTWDLPLYLPDRKKYTAMVKIMERCPVNWSAEYGGEIKICFDGQDGNCPFGPGDDFCFCKYFDNSVRHDFATWGEDPWAMRPGPRQKLSPEEEAAFEQEMMILELQRIYGEDWEKFADADLLSGPFTDDDLVDYFFGDDGFENDFDSDLWAEEEAGDEEEAEGYPPPGDEGNCPDEKQGPNQKNGGSVDFFDES